MDNIHTKPTDPSIHPGVRYAVSINGEQLYDATICAVNGCWATLRVEQPLPGKYASHYSPGDIFDVKTAMYVFREQPKD